MRSTVYSIVMFLGRIVALSGNFPFFVDEIFARAFAWASIAFGSDVTLYYSV